MTNDLHSGCKYLSQKANSLEEVFPGETNEKSSALKLFQYLWISFENIIVTSPPVPSSFIGTDGAKLFHLLP